MIERKPYVTIGMPVYNGEKYIRQALDSLLAQEYEYFELLISDNASTDATQHICEEYAKRDQRIEYVRQKENIGAHNNFRFVFENARCEFFLWAAHDDLREPDALSTLIACFSGKHDVVFAGSFYDTINFITNDICLHGVVPQLSSENNIFQNLCQLVQFPIPGFIYGLFRTSAIKQTQFIKNEYFDFADLYLLYEVALIGKLRIVPRVLYHTGITEVVREYKTVNSKLPGFNLGYFKL